MAISPLSGAGPAGVSGISPSQKPAQSFGKVLQARLENAPTPVQPQAPQTEARAAQNVQPGKCRVEGAKPTTGNPPVSATQVLDQVNQAQQRMEQILKVAESGRSFSPAELLSLQTHVYRASQELDLAGKVVEKATGGVKQVLQTQV
jgi:flagellar hook-basal body complex protein FliE